MITVYWIPVVLRLVTGGAPTERTRDFMWGWWSWEGGNGGPMRNVWPSPKFNWLCSQRKAVGSSDFNLAHVQNYPAWAVGVAATVATLRQPQYARLRAALVTGDPFTLDQRAGVRECLSTWVDGQVTVHGLQYADRVLDTGGNWGNTEPVPPTLTRAART